MKVSIITPFYYGNQYMPGFEQMLDSNFACLSPEDEVEVIIVNDSPDERVRISGIHAASKEWRVITNEKNLGIHASRVNGLSHATGDYIIFLDQDDRLVKTAVAEMLEEAKHPHGIQTLIVTNAWMGEENGRTLRYRNRYQKRIIGQQAIYLTVGTQIISPGHTLIPKKLIPDFWKQNIMKVNGADDMMLWLLLLAEGCYFKLLDIPLYEHCYTAKNLSESTVRMDDSYYEMIDILKTGKALPEKKLRTLKRMVSYKAWFRRSNWFGKLCASLMHPVLAGINFRYQIGKRLGI